MKTWVNDNGTPRELTKIWANDSGVVRSLTKLWTLDNGIVRQIFGSLTSFPVQLIPTNNGTPYGAGWISAISGNTVVIGHQWTDDTEQGAWVFTGSGTTWAQQQKLISSDFAAGDLFGRSVAIDGNTIVVGAFAEDTTPNTNQGAVYVFTRSGTTWTQQAKLLASDAASTDWFGLSVAISGDTIAVGAPLEDNGSTTDQGAVYVFTRSGSTWTQQQKLLISDAYTNDNVGTDISIDANTIVVGVRGKDSPQTSPNNNQGAAYVFTRSGSTWTQQAKLTKTPTLEIGEFFGDSVSVRGNTLSVGAPTSGNNDTGAVYVFTRSGSTWTLSQTIVSPLTPVANSNFGASAVTDSDTLLVSWAESSTAYYVAIYKKSAGTFNYVKRFLAPNSASIQSLSLDKGTQLFVMSTQPTATSNEVYIYPV